MLQIAPSRGLGHHLEHLSVDVHLLKLLQLLLGELGLEDVLPILLL